MTCSRNVDKEKGGVELPNGLVNDHVYTVLDCRELEDPPIALVQIRNPWGRVEWKGDWSDDSDVWTAKIKAEIRPTFIKNDGVFWMSFKDFVTNFSWLQVGKCKDEY